VKNISVPYLIGIFFIALATLILEISLTRILSVALWYHFAFMVVSLALLGYGASGALLMLFPRLQQRDAGRTLSFSASLFSFFSFISYLIANQIPFDPARFAWDSQQWAYLLLYYLTLSLPFFFSGLTIAVALTRFAREAGRLYFSDLVGAGLGCGLVLLLFAPCGGAGVVLFSSALGVFSALSFSVKKQRWFRAGQFLWLAFLALVFWIRPAPVEIRISPYKSLPSALRYPGARLIDTRENSFSRIDIIESPAVRFAPGLSLKYLKPLPRQIGISVDGAGLSAITYYDGKRESLEFTSYLPSALPYYLSKVGRVLVIEPRGGMDILVALYQQAGTIEGVELNPLIRDTMVRDYRQFSGNLYQREGVEVKIGEARSYLSQTLTEYDLIQLSLFDVLGASSTGLQGLNEDYRFTEEAIGSYFNHIKEGGFLSISTYLLPPPRGELRMVSSIISALEKKRERDPGESLVVIRSWGVMSLLLKRGEISGEDVSRIKDFCSERGFDLVYYPGIDPEEVNRFNRFNQPIYYELITRLIDRDDRETLFQEYPFDITAVSDDRPFFFHFFKLGKLVEVYRGAGEKWQIFFEGGYLVPLVFLQALIASLILIFLPVLLSRRRAETSSPPPAVLSGKKGRLLSYFFFIGLGFMFIEISLIQKFILYLGHPVYAISMVLATLLIFSAVGSYLSGRWIKDRGTRLMWIIFFLSANIIFYSFALPGLFNATLGMHLISRQFITVLLLFPLGLLMGVPFPTGIRIAERLSSDIIPWAWCINGCSSVLSSILAVMVALIAGFKSVLLTAALMYFFAILCVGWITTFTSGNSKEL
jgi:hypothetical protein